MNPGVVICGDELNVSNVIFSVLVLRDLVISMVTSHDP